jgi:hypothetical protein
MVTTIDEVPPLAHDDLGARLWTVHRDLDGTQRAGPAMVALWWLAHGPAVGALLLATSRPFQTGRGLERPLRLGPLDVTAAWSTSTDIHQAGDPRRDVSVTHVVPCRRRLRRRRRVGDPLHSDRLRHVRAAATTPASRRLGYMGSDPPGFRGFRAPRAGTCASGRTATCVLHLLAVPARARAGSEPSRSTCGRPRARDSRVPERGAQWAGRRRATSPAAHDVLATVSQAVAGP